MTKHRIEFMQNVNFVAQHVNRYAHDMSQFDDLVVGLRQKFMKRRIKSANSYGQASHDVENFFEILFLHRQQFGEGAPPPGLIVGENHLPHSLNSITLKKHMLG